MAKSEELCSELYEKAWLAADNTADGLTKTFSTDELLDLDVVRSKDELVLLCQQLADSQLFRLLTLDNKLQCALRTKDIAGKIRRLTDDELIVYQHVESAGTNGAWTKTLKSKTGLVQTVINKVIRVLEGRELIKNVKNIKNPTQKSYILAHLDPGEDVKGGPWHSDGELDTDLISIIAEAVIRFIEGMSWSHKHIKVERARSISPVHLDNTVSPPPAAGNKRKRPTNEVDIEDINLKQRKRHTDHVKVQVQVAHPPSYDSYPATGIILNYVKESGILKPGVNLKQEDVQGLLDMLVLDDRIERVNSGYRSIRGVRGVHEAMKGAFSSGTGDHADDAEGSGLMQAPCGRCPIFDLCQEGGPVNAGNCEYFEQWLTA